MASTAPTNSYWVTADRKRSDANEVDLVDALTPVEVALMNGIHSHEPRVANEDQMVGRLEAPPNGHLRLITTQIQSLRGRIGS